MRKKKRIPVSIMLLVFLFLLTGCTLGGTKQEAETKVDYYIGVVDDNAPYYYEEDGLPKGYYADFVAAMAKEEPFTYKFVPVDASSYNGEVYSIPFFVHTPVVFYRTDLFEEAGIMEFPKTWEEYEEAAKKWLGTGAQPTETVAKLLKAAGIQ